MTGVSKFLANIAHSGLKNSKNSSKLARKPFEKSEIYENLETEENRLNTEHNDDTDTFHTHEIKRSTLDTSRLESLRKTLELKESELAYEKTKLELSKIQQDEIRKSKIVESLSVFPKIEEQSVEESPQINENQINLVKESSIHK